MRHPTELQKRRMYSVLVGGSLMLAVVIIARTISVGAAQLLLTSESSAVSFLVDRGNAVLEWRPVQSAIFPDADVVIDRSGGPQQEADRVEFVSRRKGEKSITPGSLVLAPGTSIAIQSDESTNAWTIDLLAPEGRLSFPVSCKGHFDLVIDGREKRIRDETQIHGYVVHSRGRSLRFTLPPDRQEPLRGGHVSQLSFLRLGGARREEGDFRRNVPSLIRATVDYQQPKLGRRIVENGDREPSGLSRSLTFQEADGHLQQLTLDHGLVALRFQGEVRGIATGVESLMPSATERVLGMNFATAVSLLATLLTLVASAFGILESWKKLLKGGIVRDENA